MKKKNDDQTRSLKVCIAVLYCCAVLLCCSNILSGVITVNPDQDISFISTNPTQTACQNSPIDPVVFLVSPGVNDVTITPSLPVGVSYSVTSGVVTISGTPVNAMSVAQNYIVSI